MLKIVSESEKMDEMLLLAEEAEDPPPPPAGGIPKQWLPGWIRWPLRVLFLPLICIDLTAQRIAKWIIRPPFKKQGKCLQRGNCCHYILLPETKGPFSYLFYLWNTQVLGFYRRDKEVYESDGQRIYVMGCRYLQKDGRCGHYSLRPTVCRKWPLIEYFGRPRLIKGCGFKAVSRSSGKVILE